jgi:hypothetical protein
MPRSTLRLCCVVRRGSTVHDRCQTSDGGGVGGSWWRQRTMISYTYFLLLLGMNMIYKSLKIANESLWQIKRRQMNH